MRKSSEVSSFACAIAFHAKDIPIRLLFLLAVSRRCFSGSSMFPFLARLMTNSRFIIQVPGGTAPEQPRNKIPANKMDRTIIYICPGLVKTHRSPAAALELGHPDVVGNCERVDRYPGHGLTRRQTEFNMPNE